MIDIWPFLFLKIFQEKRVINFDLPHREAAVASVSASIFLILHYSFGLVQFSDRRKPGMDQREFREWRIASGARWNQIK